MKVLLDVGANPDLQDVVGNSVLLLAASAGNAEIIQMLIRKGANLDLRSRAGASAATVAQSRGHAHAASLLANAAQITVKHLVAFIRQAYGKPPAPAP